MSVKFIFKVLVGTTVIIILSCLVAEWLNIFMTANQLKTIAKISTRQACVLFSQETFRSGGTGLKDVEGSNGKVLASSNFYGLTGDDNQEDIYKSMFTGDKMQAYVNSIKNYKLGNFPYSGSDSAIADKLPWESFKEWYLSLRNNSEAGIGSLYKKNLMTPLNMGITYLDSGVLEKMYKWNICATLIGSSNGVSGSDTIVGTGETTTRNYIDYRGFRIYTDTAKITNIAYTLYDRKIDKDNAFRNLTSIGVDSADYITLADDDERRYVVVATVTSSVEVDYIGVTPLFKKGVIKLLTKVGSDEVDNTDESASEYSGARYKQQDINIKVNKNTELLESVVTYYVMR